ncbi:uncharacterized protein LOC106877508 [Octopus bimaculoides]|nr:uncharacterized protein LOC106877508 [Octopus bimaculoides]
MFLFSVFDLYNLFVLSESYMYTESSKGQPEHTSKLVFPNIRASAGKSLYFTYYITKNNGKLQLESEDSYGNNIELFQEFGKLKDENWNFACVNVPNYSRNYTYRFIARRTLGFNGHIALLDVGFKEGYCQARSISCNFTNPMICQYHNFMYSKWERVQSGNVSGSTNDVYMQATSIYNTLGLASPSENITSSCVQIRYKIIDRCNLTIYNALNKKLLFSVASQGTTPWLIYQIYIEKNTPTKFIFLKDYAHNIFYRPTYCSVLLDYINVTKNKCPDLGKF